MLDSLAEGPPQTIVPVSEAYQPITPEQAQKVVKEAEATNLPQTLDVLLQAYDKTQADGTTQYKDGVSALITDLTGDIAGSGEARRVLGMAQKYLTRDELRAAVQFFQQTRGFWNKLLTEAELDRQFDAKEYKKTPERRLEASQFQQQLAHLLYEMGHYHPQAVERQVLEVATQFVDEIAGRTDSGRLDEARLILDGARAQAALMKGFQDSGYYILVPDPDDEVEMKKTDLKGVDFVAISAEGRIIFVDAKGSRGPMDHPHVLDRAVSYVAQDHIFAYLNSQREHPTDFHPGIAAARRQHANHLDIVGAEITLPTRPQFMQLGQIHPSHKGPFMHSVISELQTIRQYATAA